MSETLIGLLHPGEMGAAVAACLTGRGYQVLWVPAGRGPATRARAAQAGLADAETITALAAQAGIILSVCPPHAALEAARAVAAAGFTGVYVDANAISPGTAHDVPAGGQAAGPAAQVAALFEGTALTPLILRNDNPAGASALKMAYAAWTKGSAALILSVRALARAEGVEDSLLAEWTLSQ